MGHFGQGCRIVGLYSYADAGLTAFRQDAVGMPMPSGSFDKVLA